MKRERCRKLILDWSLVRGGGVLSHGVIFNLGSAKVCSRAIIETYMITVTDYYMTLYFYLIVLSLLVVILWLINLTVYQYFLP